MKHGIGVRSKRARDQRRIGEIACNDLDPWIGERRRHDVDQHQLGELAFRAARIGKAAALENGAGEATAEKSRATRDDYAHLTPPVMTTAPLSKRFGRVALSDIIR